MKGETGLRGFSFRWGLGSFYLLHDDGYACIALVWHMGGVIVWRGVFVLSFKKYGWLTFFFSLLHRGRKSCFLIFHQLRG